jgi:hypothetical protein
VATARPRSTADVRRELEAAEQRFVTLFAHWQASASTRSLPADGVPSRELLDSVEEVLRNQRGALDRMHQLWIEYAQQSGLHAPQ